MRFLPLLAVLLLAACSSVREQWAEATLTSISYPALYGVVLSTVDSRGFPVRERDPHTGEIHSEWVYGQSRAAVRGPARQRVHASIEPQPGDAFLLRLRVEQEVVRKGGMLATNVRESENWEPYEDNFDEAEILMGKIAALLAANRSREPTP